MKEKRNLPQGSFGLHEQSLTEERPTSQEFRRAYMEYSKSNILYRITKGKEIFNSVISDIKSAIKETLDAIKELKEENTDENSR